VKNSMREHSDWGEEEDVDEDLDEESDSDEW
jgi:hypothetical protein